MNRCRLKTLSGKYRFRKNTEIIFTRTRQSNPAGLPFGGLNVERHYNIVCEQMEFFIKKSE